MYEFIVFPQSGRSSLRAIQQGLATGCVARAVSRAVEEDKSDRGQKRKKDGSEER